MVKFAATIVLSVAALVKNYGQEVAPTNKEIRQFVYDLSKTEVAVSGAVLDAARTLASEGLEKSMLGVQREPSDWTLDQNYALSKLLLIGDTETLRKLGEAWKVSPEAFDSPPLYNIIANCRQPRVLLVIGYDLSVADAALVREESENHSSDALHPQLRAKARRARIAGGLIKSFIADPENSTVFAESRAWILEALRPSDDFYARRHLLISDWFALNHETIAAGNLSGIRVPRSESRVEGVPRSKPGSSPGGAQESSDWRHGTEVLSALIAALGVIAFFFLRARKHKW